jgi:hypothetical protein
MATSVPAIIWPINFALQSGNPLTQGAGSPAALDSAQLIRGDQRLLQIYFLVAALAQGAAPANVQLVAGTTLTVAGKLANDLGATTILFEATGFVPLQDTSNAYFAQAFLDLDTDEIAAAFAAAGTGQTTLACLVDIIVNVPAQAAAGAAPAVPASRATFQIAVTLKQQVYAGTESTPTPATPTYPAGASVQALLAALLNAIGGVFNLAAADGTIFPVLLSGSDAAPELAVFPAGTFVPAFAFPAGTSGQAILRNQSTGNAFPLVLQGSDAAPTFAVLPRGSAIPAVTYQLAGNGQLSLLNQTTGSFLPVAIGGTDAAPTLEIIPAA